MPLLARAAKVLATTACAMSAGPCLAQSWNTAKTDLESKGITPAIVYDGDFASNLAGGLRRGTDYTGNLHLQLTFDGEALLGWPGVSAFVDGLHVHGAQASERVGDAQGLSNIAAPPQSELYEAWIQYNSPRDRFSALAGRYDLNTEFYRLASADVFLNSSLGIGPELAQSGAAGPSIFPDTSVGVRFAYKPSFNTVVRAAVLDGVPVDRPPGSPSLFSSSDGLLLTAEAAFLTRPGAPPAPGMVRSLIGRMSTLQPYEDKIAFGLWHYTGSYPDLRDVDAFGAPVRRDGSSGAYLLLDHRLYQDAVDSSKHVSAFIQAGVGDSRVNRFGSYLGFGAVAAGFVPGRQSDQIGIAAAIASNGSHYRSAQQQAGLRTDPAETAIEITYLSQIADWLAVQPDLQYIIHPNTDPGIGSALAFQLQLEISL